MLLHGFTQLHPAQKLLKIGRILTGRVTIIILDQFVKLYNGIIETK